MFLSFWLRRNLAIITQAETIRNFAGIKADLKLTGYAAYAIELLDRFTQEEGRNPETFSAAGGTVFQRLEDDPEPLTSLHYYEVQLLAVLGFRPELNKCVACGKKSRRDDIFHRSWVVRFAQIATPKMHWLGVSLDDGA